VWQGRDVFDGLDLQASGFQRGNRAFATTAWALHFDVDVFDAELTGLLGCLLSSTLAGKRRTLAASLEAGCASTGPAERIALGVGDRDHRVVEGRYDVGDSHGHVTSSGLLLDLRRLTALGFGCFGCFGHVVLDSKLMKCVVAMGCEAIDFCPLSVVSCNGQRTSGKGLS
jgi:hypothetical protein